MIKKNKYGSKGSFIPIGMLSIIFSFIILYFKYEFNSIRISEIRFDYIGNILNLLISLSTLSASIVLKYSKKTFPSNKRIIAYLFITISFVLLVSLLLIDKISFLQTNNLIFNFPLKKFYMIVIFLIAISMHIYITLYLWGLLFEIDSLYEIRTLIRTFLVLVFMMIFSLLYVWNIGAFNFKNNHGNYEYGFVPGAAVWSKNKPSPIFEGRIKKALLLYREKSIVKIIVSGGNAPGELSEAESARRYLIKLGVNSKDVIYENKSSTTTEQIKYLKENFTKKSILIISDGFHLSRATQIAKFFNINVGGASSDYSLSFEKSIFYRARESVALLMFWLFAI